METITHLTPVLTGILSYAVKAPSIHNTQPWRFVVDGERTIEIHPDFTRALPVADGDNRELYISLGCALENLLIAARQHGFYADFSLEKNAAQRTFIRVYLLESDVVPKDPLFKYIPLRQTARNHYENVQIPSGDLAQLQKSFDCPQVGLYMFTTPATVGELMPFITEGIRKQLEHPHFWDELAEWLRFTDEEAEEHSDGLRMDAMGLPNMGKWIGKLVIKNFISAHSETKRWEDLVRHSSALALFTASENTEENWILTGRAFQRFSLTATKLHISHSHVNMPCRDPELRDKMRAHFRLSGIPMLLIRIGYSEQMPYSHRRALEDAVDIRLPEE